MWTKGLFTLLTVWNLCEFVFKLLHNRALWCSTRFGNWAQICAVLMLHLCHKFLDLEKKIISCRNRFMLFVSNVLLIMFAYPSILSLRICKYFRDILWKTHSPEISFFAILKTLFIHSSYKPSIVFKTVLGILIMYTRKCCR